MILALIGVLGLFFAAFYLIRKLNLRVASVSGSRMRVLDRIAVGRDSFLMVVSVGGRLMLISSTPQRVEKLCDLEMSEEEYFPDSGDPQEGMKFSEALKKVLKGEGGKNQ